MIYVDPSAELGSLLADVAHRGGQRLHVCVGKRDALGMIKDDAPHIAIILRISPDTANGLSIDDSLELIRAVRQQEHRQTLPVVILLDQNIPELANEALRSGATEVFHFNDRAALTETLSQYAIREKLPTLSGQVLLVEDSESFAQHVGTLCRSLGLSVDTVASANDGFDRLMARDYHLAIIDVLLDGLHTGIELVRRIRNLDSGKAAMPILVMSGYRDAARRIEALRAGADEFIDKPVVDAELIWRIQRLLGDVTDATLPRLVPTELKKAREDWQRRGLSQREIDICNALIDGASDKQIACDLGISFWTVRSHVGSIFTKLGLLNRRELLTRYLPGRDQ